MVPAGTVDAYRNKASWNLFANIQEIPERSTASTANAFYIYRNDGQFNAFFREEVDSIGYSHYDSNGQFYDDIVTQLVYTADSIYQIPLAAVDSVSFVQPETIFQPDVKQMNFNGLMDYLQAVEGMSLFFSSSIPKELRPKVGEILLSTDFDSPLLSDGFAGKIVNTAIVENGFRVDCEYINPNRSLD